MKFGIIGLGNIGRVHAKNIQDGLVEDAELVAVANQPIESMDDFAAQGIACFGDASELIEVRTDGTKVNRPGFDGGWFYWFPTPVGEACWSA